MTVPPFRLLVVCTANICRSVMAERMLREKAHARGLAVEVSSCGVLFDDAAASDTVIAVLAERDIDARDHRSRKFTPAMAEGIDLIVTMERTHARELTVALDGGSSRVHTLGALVEWLQTEEGSGSEEDHGPSANDRIAAFAAGRSASALLGGGSDEIGDPHGRSKRIHRKAAERIDDLCQGLLDGLFPE